MYDSLEEDEVGDKAAPARRNRSRLLTGAGVVAGLAILIGVALYTTSRPTSDNTDLLRLETERKAYKMALSEPAPAVRRARLKDFINTYNSSERLSAARAQLTVLNQAEAKEWAALSHIVFDTEKTQQEKIRALERYENLWDSALLGGRSSDVDRIRTNLSTLSSDLPDRDLPFEIGDDAKSPDADSMAGANTMTPFEVVPPVTSENNDPPSDTQSIIIPAKLRRNVRPRYPRRAQSVGAEALIVLRLFVDERGRVDETELVSSQADRYEKDFIRAAERAAMKTRYTPRTVNGEPVSTTQGIIKRFRFQMSE